MTEVVVDALERTIKLAFNEFQLDRTSFISGLAFIADPRPRRRELAEERLIPEVLDVVGKELPAAPTI
jgi:hypothetical protein